MFKNKLVAGLKVDGKIVREDKNTIYLPYGTQYNIFIKNLNTIPVQIHSISNYVFKESDLLLESNIDIGQLPKDFMFDEDIDISIVFGEKRDVLTMSLRGLEENSQISSVVTTKSKKICTSCGKKYKSSYKYCPYDGTFLNNQ